MGDFIDTGHTNYFETFFSENDIELNELNIKQFRQLIYLYSGLKINGIQDDFKTYVNNNINPKNEITAPREIDYNDGTTDIKFYKLLSIDKKTQLFFNTLFNIILNDNRLTDTTSKKQLTIRRAYNDDIIKLDLYNMFKTFNDKWIAGNSIGQRTLMEEFLFLDKANKDIGDKLYIDFTKLIEIEKNPSINLFGVFVQLLKDSNVDIRPLPSYVNFYGTNYGKNKKISPSNNVAKNLFGTFLEVDYEESSPKIILQYIGPSSKHIKYNDIDKNNRYDDDSYDISNTNNNPVIIAPEAFSNIDYSKSNRAVAFEVSFGDQNQSIFKNIEIDQSTIRNTFASYQVYENLGSSAAGAGGTLMDTNLFDIYRLASYECTVTCMGNVMIQPTMFFYVKNIPMFRGTYWITEVSHNIRTTGIETTFKGSRMPVQSLPDPESSFISTYRVLFDKMIKKVQIKNKEQNRIETTEKTLIIDGSSYTIEQLPQFNGEKIVNIAGANEFGINFNGFNGEKYIQLIDNPNINLISTQWLKTTVISMMDNENLNDDDIISVSLIDEFNIDVKWKNIKNNNQEYYATKFNKNFDFIYRYLNTTYFYNPKTKKNYSLKTNINPSQNTYEGPINMSTSDSKYGLELSSKLMNKLSLKTGDVVYFKMNSITNI